MREIEIVWPDVATLLYGDKPQLDCPWRGTAILAEHCQSCRYWRGYSQTRAPGESFPALLDIWDGTITACTRCRYDERHPAKPEPCEFCQGAQAVHFTRGVTTFTKNCPICNGTGEAKP